MNHLNYVFRRGAVYVWRRRVPSLPHEKRHFVQVSLKTRKFSTAKEILPLLNCAFMNFILKVNTQKITWVEAQQFLTAIVSSELEHIEAERYSEPHAKTPDEWRNRYLDERARTIALRKLAIMGPAAQLFEDERPELLQECATEDALERVESQIQSLTRVFKPEFADETAELAKSYIARSSFSDDDLRALLRIRLTGKANAMAQSDRKKQTTPFIGLEASKETMMVPLVETASVSRPTREGYDDNLHNLCKAYLAEEFRDVRAAAEQKKVAKARRQNDAVITQFCAAVGKPCLADIQQQDLHFYVSVLDRMGVVALPRREA